MFGYRDLHKMFPQFRHTIERSSIMMFKFLKGGQRLTALLLVQMSMGGDSIVT